MFRRHYPYLEDSYTHNTLEEQDRIQFLSEVDRFVNQKISVRITLLNWNEAPIREIQGQITSGTLTKDGNSSVRRTCSFSASVDGSSYDVDDLKMDYSINKKVFLEMGVKNYTDKYPEFPILWFPQGVFFISSLSISSGANQTVNLSISLKDKMAGLNGEVGGTFPATTQLDIVDTQNPDGEYVTEKVLVYEIIQEVVNHFGGEPLANIVIEDVDTRIKRVVQWRGSTPLYMIPQGTDEESSNMYQVTTNPPQNAEGMLEFTAGSDVGYVYDDFVYTGELTASLGESVVTVLDKIKSYLGNYEYFYDEFGVFHFREIKNYLNTTQVTTLLDEMSENDYLVETTTGKTVYSFSDDLNLTNVSVNPQYGNIKNDYVIEGLRKTSGSDIATSIRYHLAIDRKPIPGNEYYQLLLYEDPTTGLTVASFPTEREELVSPGDFNLIYRVPGEGKATYWYWNGEGYSEIVPIKDYWDDSAEGYITKDWRTEIYLRGMLSRNNGTDAGQYFNNLSEGNASLTGDSSIWIGNIYHSARNDKVDVDFYFEELSAFWPQIYNLETQRFYAEEEYDQTTTAPTVQEGEVGKYIQEMTDWLDTVWDESHDEIYDDDMRAEITRKIISDLESFPTDYAESTGKTLTDIERYKIQVLLDECYAKLESIAPGEDGSEDSGEEGISTMSEAEEDAGTSSNPPSDPESGFVEMKNELYNFEMLKGVYFYDENDFVAQRLQDTLEAYNSVSAKVNELQNRFEQLASAKNDFASEEIQQEIQDIMDAIEGIKSEVSKEEDDPEKEPVPMEIRVFSQTLTHYMKSIALSPEERVWRLETFISEMKEALAGYEEGSSVRNLLQDYISIATSFTSQLKLILNQEEGGDDDDSSSLPDQVHLGKRMGLLANGVYYLDFIDSATSQLGEYSVQNIGRRTDGVYDEDINCLFDPEFPDLVFINRDDETIATDENGKEIHDEDGNPVLEQDRLEEECDKQGQPWTRVDSSVFSALATGGYNNSAYARLQSELYIHTSYQKTVSLTSRPVFYLEPNSRVHINDSSTNTRGDYMVQNLSIPLSPTGTMSTSCSECLQKM